jgi:asparagine synthase (glutamine-hydrolysing)
MTDALAHRGTVALRVDGSAAIATLGRGASSAALADGGWVAWAGRLDDKDELAGAVGSSPRAVDAAIVARAFERWGDACVSRLLGDFALVVWDARARKLFCARDTIGAKPFYYAFGRGGFVCASELRAVLADESVARDFDEGMIAEHLACVITSIDATLFRAVRRLPPAHGLVADASGVRVRRYWEPTPLPPLARPAQNAERLRATLTDAVTCRLRAAEHVAIELSGGLDSSSITMLAARAAPAIDVRAETFSLVFPGLPCDESSYIGAVERAGGLPSYRIVARPTRASEYAERAARYRDFPGHPNGLMAIPLHACARDRGATVCLSGIGGDDWFDAAPRAPARTGLRAIASRALRALDRLRLPPNAAYPPWISPALARRTSLAERVRGADAWQTHALELEEREAAAHGLDLRHPFEDRRIIELSLGLPASELREDGTTKLVLRRALHDLLPESVRTRTTKAEFSCVFDDALRELGGEGAFRSLRLAEMGYVDERIARDAFAAAWRGGQGGAGQGTRQGKRQGKDSTPFLPWHWWMVLGVELFVRAQADDSA